MVLKKKDRFGRPFIYFFIVFVFLAFEFLPLLSIRARCRMASTTRNFSCFRTVSPKTRSVAWLLPRPNATYVCMKSCFFCGQTKIKCVKFKCRYRTRSNCPWTRICSVALCPGISERRIARTLAACGARVGTCPNGSTALNPLML